MHLQWCLLFIMDYSNLGVAHYKRRSLCKMNTYVQRISTIPVYDLHEQAISPQRDAAQEY